MKRKIWIGTAIVLAIAAAVVLVWFQPQKLVLDSPVDEAAPTAAPRGTSGPRIVGMGEFRPLAHKASGLASFIRTEEGTTLRLEDFEVENGPDLFVYLSAGDMRGPGRALADDFVDLGPLKGNIGDQNYSIPAGTDLERYKTAVVWCRRFTVAFAAAEVT
jgi:hypothetical protein